VQTFLPYADFARSAAVLDSPRLGKQRVECLQVLRALELDEYGWRSHPVVVMWRGRTPALVVYSLEVVRAWRERGHADSTEPLITEFAPEHVGSTQADLARDGLLPGWLGGEDVHRSHRSALLRKDRRYYGRVFGDEPDDLPYSWPAADDLPPAPRSAGTAAWVVRPRSHGELGVCLEDGVVGVGTQSGVDVDATGLGPAELRALARELSGRRPGKDLRQLPALLAEVAEGDLVAVPVREGTQLLLGRVTGGYRFAPRAALPHRRPVRWTGVVPRAAVRPPALLQDPRALFAVRLEPAAVHRTDQGA